MPVFPALQNLFAAPRSRSQQRIRNYCVPAAEVLEFRRMLTNAAPEIVDLTGENGVVTGTIEDDGTSFGLDLVVTIGNSEEQLSVEEGEEFSLDVSSYIPANTTASVTVTVTEVDYNEVTGETTLLSTSQTIEAAGAIVLPVEFEWIEADYNHVFGQIEEIDPTSQGEATVMYREVGDATWLFGSDIFSDRTFSVTVGEADGERDFEFAVILSSESDEIVGGTHTFYDLAVYDVTDDDEGEEDDTGTDGDGEYGTDDDGEYGDGYYNNYSDDDDDDTDDYFSDGWGTE